MQLEKATWRDHGSEVDGADKDGWTPLSYASSYCHLPVCEFLFKTGADKEHASQDGYTPLPCV